MKHLTKFETQTLFDEAKDNLDKPHVSLTVDNDTVHYLSKPQSAETTRRLSVLPVAVANIGQAVSEGDLPDPCYIFWDATCLMKVYTDDGVHADIQVCNLSQSQTPENCYPYIYESSVDNDDIIIKNTGMCIDEETDVSYDLLRFGISQLHLVGNSEDWFTRLQYHFDY